MVTQKTKQFAQRLGPGLITGAAVKAFEHPADVRVTLHVAAVGRKRDFGAGGEKLLDLFNRA